MRALGGAAGRVTAADLGIKRARVGVTINGSSAANVTHTWAEAFSDANYIVSADLELDADSNITAPGWYIRSVTAESVTVRVVNNAITQQTYHVHLIGIPDA